MFRGMKSKSHTVSQLRTFPNSPCLLVYFVNLLGDPQVGFALVGCCCRDDGGSCCGLRRLCAKQAWLWWLSTLLPDYHCLCSCSKNLAFRSNYGRKDSPWSWVSHFSSDCAHMPVFTAIDANKLKFLSK